MSDLNQELTGFALLLAYAIPIGLAVMLFAQAMRGRRARLRVQEAETELRAFADALAGEQLDSEAQAESAPESDAEMSSAGEDSSAGTEPPKS